jgi:hypothetical protein
LLLSYLVDNLSTMRNLLSSICSHPGNHYDHRSLWFNSNSLKIHVHDGNTHEQFLEYSNAPECDQSAQRGLLLM